MVHGRVANDSGGPMSQFDMAPRVGYTYRLFSGGPFPARRQEGSEDQWPAKRRF